MKVAVYIYPESLRRKQCRVVVHISQESFRRKQCESCSVSILRLIKKEAV